MSTNCFELVTFVQRNCSEKCTDSFSAFFSPSISFTRLVLLMEEWQFCMAIMIFPRRQIAEELEGGKIGVVTYACCH